MDNHNVDTLSCACEFYRERTADNQHYTRISGWTHDIPALIAANTDIDLFFFHTNGDIECVTDRVEGIDYFEDMDGFFCVREHEFDEALRQVEEHDKQH